MQTGTKTEKRCSKCGVVRPVEQWGRNSKRSDGLAQWCKPCAAEYAKVYNQRPEQKAKAAARALARWRAKSPEQRSEEQRVRRAKRYHMAMYSMTREQYEQILEIQGGSCAICSKTSDRTLAVDHDHSCCPGPRSCGKCVRGLLCTTCNVWLGFYENPVWRSRAEAYLADEITRLQGEA